MPLDDVSVLPASIASFHDYFKLDAEPDDVAGAFGYLYGVERLTLPQVVDTPDWAGELGTRFERWLRVVRLGNEAGRRETMIAPVLLETAAHVHARLSIEYGINVAPQLKGRLDYLLRAPQSLLVVEAKDDDMGHGATQLVAEMIALDRWGKMGERTLYGALTTGTLWQFATMNRESKTITQDTRGFSVPDQLDELIRTLIGILQDEPTNET